MSRLKTHNSLTVGHRDRPQPSPTFRDAVADPACLMRWEALLSH